MNFHPVTAFILFPAMLLFLELGRRLHLHRKNPTSSSAIEGAVFGLFGLLLAFTFSGAISRYDEHRRLVTQETNDIGTAWLRLALLPPDAQPPLRQLFRDYTTSRLHLFDAVGPEVSPTTIALQNQIWHRAVIAAASPGANPDATKLLLPAINDMIDITSTRQSAFNMHPPPVVFLLLFSFSMACAFIAGYGLHGERPNWLYAFVLAFTVTLTVYATLEIEYPRQGLLRFTQLDQPFINLADSMK